MNIIDLVAITNIGFGSLLVLVCLGLGVLAQLLVAVWHAGMRARRRRRDMEDWLREGGMQR